MQSCVGKELIDSDLICKGTAITRLEEATGENKNNVNIKCYFLDLSKACEVNDSTAKFIGLGYDVKYDSENPSITIPTQERLIEEP